MRCNSITMLSDNNANLLFKYFKPCKIKEAVWSCAPEKLPRPDGFPFIFIRTFWNLLEIISSKFSIISFHRGSLIMVNSNSSFISLVPNVRPFFPWIRPNQFYWMYLQSTLQHYTLWRRHLLNLSQRHVFVISYTDEKLLAHTCQHRSKKSSA